MGPAGKHKTTGLNLQIVTDAWGQLITIGEPIEGRAHDMRALKHSGLKEGSGYFTPRKKPAGGELTDTQKRYNAQISAIRAPVERAIADLKTWRRFCTPTTDDPYRPFKTPSTPSSDCTSSSSTDVLHSPLGIGSTVFGSLT